MKKLKDICLALGVELDEDIEVLEIVDDSRQVRPGYLFIALEGSATNGNFFIEEARKNGAVRIISDVQLSDTIFVPNLSKKLEVLARYFYDYKDDLDLYGVTGTSGKSTLAYLLAALFNLLKEKTLLLCTTKGIPNSHQFDLTTPLSLELYRTLKKAKDEGYKNVVFECSSIGIAKGRIARLFFKAIFITNITKDHLDFHHTLRNYRQTKLDYALSHTNFIYVLDNFKYLRRNESQAVKVIRLKSKTKRLSYSVRGTTFSYQNQEYKTNLLLPFNKENTLLALSYFLQKGYRPEVLKDALTKIPALKGRVERVLNEDIYIDYAHTSVALKRLLSEFYHHINKKLIVIIGAGGNRDPDKRKDYRKSLKKYSTLAILTDDNPRYEDNLAILAQLAGNEDFILLPNRKEAIRIGVNLYKSLDNHALLIIGKGPEEFQIIKDKKVPFSDREEVERCLKN